MRTLRTIVDGVPAWVENFATRVNQPVNQSDVYWRGDYANASSYAGSGTHTIKERDGLLSIGTTAVGSSDNVNAVLFSRSISAGDMYSTLVRGAYRTDYVWYAGVVFTDGTSSSSNAVAGTVQLTSNTIRTYIRSGTLGSFTTVDTLRQVSPQNSPLIVGAEYDASNSFKMWVSSDGVSWSHLGHTAVSKTMTPTHVGCVWFASVGDDVSISFGPLLKTSAP